MIQVLLGSQLNDTELHCKCEFEIISTFFMEDENLRYINICINDNGC